MEHHIPRGLMEYRGEKVDFASVEGVRVLTVESANDHLCPPDQEEAAHGIFSKIPANDKHNHIQEGVGQYGFFSGSKFAAKIFSVTRLISKDKCRLWGRMPTVRFRKLETPKPPVGLWRNIATIRRWP